jgi:hypothetical protein
MGFEPVSCIHGFILVNLIYESHFDSKGILDQFVNWYATRGLRNKFDIKNGPNFHTHQVTMKQVGLIFMLGSYIFLV